MHLVWHLQTTPTSFMSVLSTADHTYSEGLIGPLHLHPGGLGNERHFITLKEEGNFFYQQIWDPMTSSEATRLGSWQSTPHRPDTPWGFALHVWSLSVSLRGLCASMHGQYDNTRGLRWAKTRKTIKLGLWTRLWEFDFHCPSLPIWKQPTNMQLHTGSSLFFHTRLGKDGKDPDKTCPRSFTSSICFDFTALKGGKMIHAVGVRSGAAAGRCTCNTQIWENKLPGARAEKRVGLHTFTYT